MIAREDKPKDNMVQTKDNYNNIALGFSLYLPFVFFVFFDSTNDGLA